MGGPAYHAPLHNSDFVSRLLLHLNSPGTASKYHTFSRMFGMVNVISEVSLSLLLEIKLAGTSYPLFCRPIFTVPFTPRHHTIPRSFCVGYSQCWLRRFNDALQSPGIQNDCTHGCRMGHYAHLGSQFPY